MKTENKIALVTGATGFVGSHLLRRLIKDAWDVHSIIRPQSNLDIIRDVVERTKIHIYDGTSKCMVQIIEKTKPSIVFHLASLFLVNHQRHDIEPLIKSNIIFGTELVNAMILNGRYNLVNTATSWQHYNNEDYNPVNLYAATKQAFEAILKYYLVSTPLKVITLKLFDTYGINDPRPKLFHLLKTVAKDQKPLSMSPGNQLIDIVYIDDVIDAFLIAADRLLEDKVNQYEDYALSSGEPVKLRDIVKTYEEVSGKSMPIEWNGRPYRDREIMVPWNKGKRMQGWIPKISMYNGIKKLISSTE